MKFDSEGKKLLDDFVTVKRWCLCLGQRQMSEKLMDYNKRELKYIYPPGNKAVISLLQNHL